MQLIWIQSDTSTYTLNHLMELLSLVFWLTIASVQSQLTGSCRLAIAIARNTYWSGLLCPAVTWNGTSITDPVLIYQDKLVVDDHASTPTRGTLICTSQDQHRVGWHNARGSSLLEDGTDDFRQIRTGSQVCLDCQLIEKIFHMLLMVCGHVDWMERLVYLYPYPCGDIW